MLGRWRGWGGRAGSADSGAVRGDGCAVLAAPLICSKRTAVLQEEGGGRPGTVRREGAVRALCGAFHSVSYLPSASAPVKGREVVCVLCFDTIRFRDELAVGGFEWGVWGVRAWPGSRRAFTPSCTELEQTTPCFSVLISSLERRLLGRNGGGRPVYQL